MSVELNCTCIIEWYYRTLYYDWEYWIDWWDWRNELIVDQSFNSSQILSFLQFIVHLVPSHPYLQHIDVSGSFVSELHSEKLSRVLEALTKQHISVEGVNLIPSSVHFHWWLKEYASNDYVTFSQFMNRNPPRILIYNRFHCVIKLSYRIYSWIHFSVNETIFTHATSFQSNYH